MRFYGLGRALIRQATRRTRLSPAEYWAWHDSLYPGRSSQSPEWRELKRHILARDGHRCRWPACGSDYLLQVDHYIPLSKGGSNDPANLWTLCKAHHELKTGRPLHDWRENKDPRLPDAYKQELGRRHLRHSPDARVVLMDGRLFYEAPPDLTAMKLPPTPPSPSLTVPARPGLFARLAGLFR